MNPLKKLYCRAFQTVFRIALPILPYRNPVILHSMAEISRRAERETSPPPTPCDG